MRTLVIGPLSPFRSGVARHTTALVRELAQRPGIELSVLSFSRQYPRILFPGSDDRDSETSPPEGVEIDFCLDSIDPLNWHSQSKRMWRTRPELAIIPAWTFFIALCLGALARSLRKNQVPVTMVVHNAEDHEAALWKRALSRFQLRQADRFITHNSTIADDLARIVPGIPTIVHPHPIFDEYPEPKGSLPISAALELLFFGIVRPYKGLDVALKAFAAAKLPDARLSIVGEIWDDGGEMRGLIDSLGLSDRVNLVSRYVSDQEAAEYFARCDAVLAPYRSASASGVVALAQRYGRPIIASDIPGLAASVIDGKTGWLFPAGDTEALADLLRTKVSRASAAAMQHALARTRDELSWRRFADAILAPYAHAAGKGPSQNPSKISPGGGDAGRNR